MKAFPTDGETEQNCQMTYSPLASEMYSVGEPVWLLDGRGGHISAISNDSHSVTVACIDGTEATVNADDIAWD